MGKGEQKNFLLVSYVLIILVVAGVAFYSGNKGTGAFSFRGTSRVIDLGFDYPAVAQSLVREALVGDTIDDGSLSPSQRTPCIPAPKPPQKIINSDTICAGTYPYGIEIGVDNVQLTCQSNTVFDGSRWDGQDGLTISGKSNIRVTGCAFSNFRGNGIAISGFQEGPYASQITLSNVESTNNGKNGITIGPDTKTITIQRGRYSSNQLNGVYLWAKYMDDLSGSVSTIPSYFPNNVIVRESAIENNRQQGIHVDAKAYQRDYWNLHLEKNLLVIFKNSIQHNEGDGIRNTGFFTVGLPPGDDSYIIGNTIQSNRGSGISILNDKELKIVNAGWDFLSVNFGIIAKNKIADNLGDGISVFIKAPATSQAMILDADADYIYANIISGNRRGVSFDADAYLPANTYRYSSKLFQNDISNNRQQGVYGKGSRNVPMWNSFLVLCNDILTNAQEGVLFDDFSITESFSGIYISQMNIIERNFGGILLNNVESSFSDLNSIQWNHVGSNPYGIKLLGTTNQVSVIRNDVESNGLQAFTPNPNIWQNNWWSDYSPTCIDTKPRDGWCDTHYPIQINDRDPQPKAGISWNHKGRGPLNVGGTIQIKQVCDRFILPPEYDPPPDVK